MEIYNLEYLQNLITNKIEESLHLEYKSPNSLDKQNDKTSEISKDVSSMANSDGGIIIYGIIEDENNRYLPKEIIPVNRKNYSKEWLEQIINDKIQPRIENIEISPVSIDNENVVYIVKVPKSNTVHQAFDKKYYKRFNFLSTAMYDYEIRDILNRAKNPEIVLEFKYHHKNNFLEIIAHNKGIIYAKYVNVIIRLPKNIVKSNFDKEINNNKVEIYLNNTIREIVNPFTSVATFWPARYEPILPKTSFSLTKISLHNYPFDFENILEWEVFCDNSNQTNGSFRLNELLNNK